MADPKADPKDFAPLSASQDAALEQMFAAARKENARPLGADLTTRILADAAASQAVAAAPLGRGSLGLLGWLGELRDAFGGWGGVAGLSSAMVAGVWIGGSDAAFLDQLPGVFAPQEAEVLSLDEDDLDLLFPTYLDLLGEI